MLSARALAILAVLASAYAIPATDRPLVPNPITTIYSEDFETPWSFPFFGNLFAPLWKLFPSFADIGPKITSEENKFEVVVNVKDYKKDDLKVKVKGDFIFIQGSHEAKQDDRDVFASQFFHTYSLPANFSGADVTAELTKDGFLIVKAPSTGNADKGKEVDREVTIVETGKPYVEEKTTEDAEKAPAVSTPTTISTTLAAAEEDNKEPTTPSEREDATEKDNVIPHGNEIQP